jgi:hypothetical protein
MELINSLRDGRIDERFFFHDVSDNTVLHPAQRLKPRPEILGLLGSSAKVMLSEDQLEQLCRSTRGSRWRAYWSLSGKDRCVSEGDSWFLYPGRMGSLGVEDIIDHLLYGDKVPIYSVDCAGDTVAEMIKEASERGNGYRTAVFFEQPVYFLFSGGANDLLETADLHGIKTGKLYFHLYNHRKGMSAADHVKPSLYELIDEVIHGIRHIFSDVFATASSVKKILVHGYAYAVPGRGEGDDLWLQDPMDRHFIPREMQRDIVRVLIDYFNEALKAIATADRRVVHIDLRDLFGDPADWYDPIHLTSQNYRKVADRFLAEIRPTKTGAAKGRAKDRGA